MVDNVVVDVVVDIVVVVLGVDEYWMLLEFKNVLVICLYIYF